MGGKGGVFARTGLSIACCVSRVILTFVRICIFCPQLADDNSASWNLPVFLSGFSSRISKINLPMYALARFPLLLLGFVLPVTSVATNQRYNDSRVIPCIVTGVTTI
nr:PREDICTED: uncharacterized protein LOC109039312 [Bemisia tabaci]